MKILLIGANGQVGTEINNTFIHSKHEILALTRNECDLADSDQIVMCLSHYDADLVINAAAYTAVDKAEDEPLLAEDINTVAVEKIAQFCLQKNIPLIHLSTDYVFDGLKEEAYVEEDVPNPQTVYGLSKLAGEQVIQATIEKYIILRVSWVFGVHGHNFVKTILNLASTREELGIVADQWGCPTPARDIARVLLSIVNHIQEVRFSEWGIYHYAGKDKTNWHAFARCFIELARQETELPLKSIMPLKTEEYVTKAQRPKNSVLATNKIEKIFSCKPHPWQDYLPEVIQHVVPS